MSLPPQQAESTRGGRLARELKEKPRKAAMLAVFLAAATWIWAGTLLGGGRGRPAAAGPNPVSGPAATPAAPGAIQNFETAMERLQTWRGPLGLHLDHKDQEVKVFVPELPEVDEDPPFPGFAEEAPEEPESVPPDLTLTGTLLCVGGRWALFRGQRVKEGETIGRYRVVAVRSREVELSDGRATWILRMPGAGLGSSAPPLERKE